jgi:hypothetical protein
LRTHDLLFVPVTGFIVGKAGLELGVSTVIKRIDVQRRLQLVDGTRDAGLVEVLQCSVNTLLERAGMLIPGK